MLARRLRALVSERPEEARVEGEGVEKPEALTTAESFEPEVAADVAPASSGTELAAAVLGKTPGPDSAQAAPGTKNS